MRWLPTKEYYGMVHNQVIFIFNRAAKYDWYHPTKTEIKFDDEHALYAILRSSIKHSLGQFNVAPVLDFDRDANLDTPYNYKI
jgi:DNA mismatch repair ATPase MutL